MIGNASRCLAGQAPHERIAWLEIRSGARNSSSEITSSGEHVYDAPKTH
jgi:hypothetical protein